MTSLLTAVLLTLGATPVSMPLQGVMHDNAGVPVIDGEFAVQFALYVEESGGDPVWSESWPPDGASCDAAPESCVKVSDGVFSLDLGTHVPLDAGVFALGAELWLGVAVETDPELPRRRLGSSAYAFHAATAGELACTACLDAEAFTEDARAALVADTLAAVAAAGVGDLESVSNGILTTRFVHVISSPSTPVPIDDNNPVDHLINTVIVPSLGTVEALTVFVELANSNISELTVSLEAPNGNVYLLHQGGPPGTGIDTSWPDPTPTLTGDLDADWVGASVAGAWTLEVVDAGYLNNDFDGAVTAWGLEVRVQSEDTIGVNGDLEIHGALTGPGVTVETDVDLTMHTLSNSRFQRSAGAPAPCAENTEGFHYLDTEEKALMVCLLGEYRRITMAVCGDGTVDVTESCDDGDLANGDGCNSACAIEPGFACDDGGPSLCDAVCGDGNVVGDETCDDGAQQPNDGCSEGCFEEFGWDCSTGTCEPVCGDGFEAGDESCDDGNTEGGDGCSATCTNELGGTFVGYGIWSQAVSSQSDAVQDAAMDTACANSFGGNARAATMEEIVENAITGRPGNNSSNEHLLGKCPNCAGNPSGSAVSGHCRLCVDPNAGWPSSYNSGWNVNCCGSSRSAICLVP